MSKCAELTVALTEPGPEIPFCENLKMDKSFRILSTCQLHSHSDFFSNSIKIQKIVSYKCCKNHENKIKIAPLKYCSNCLRKLLLTGR